MRTPIVRDSRQTIPFNRAARLLPEIFENKATRIIPMVYPHVIPLSNKPIFVFNPDKAKYFPHQII
jgi:hypothetical protein